jgi:arylsulfatase A-like enzyme
VKTLSNWGPYELDPESNSVGRTLQEAGYETTWVGRWDLGAENITDLGWEFTRNIDVTGSTEDEAQYRDRTTVTEVNRYLRSYDGEKPFFVTASFNLPHPPFFEDEEFAEQYDFEDVSLPSNFDDDLTTKPDFHRERAEQPECQLSPEETREIRYQYRTMVSRVDAYVGEILETLRDEGLDDDTVVVFLSDHGDMQGAHRLNKKGVVAYEEILRVPLIVRHPEMETPRDRIPDLVSTAAVPGTLVEMAVEINKGMLLALHLGRMKDEGRVRTEQVSLGKLNNVHEALAMCREARSILGANGITLEYPIVRHLNNLESVYTYEGTHEIHTLILGKALTGLDAFD